MRRKITRYVLLLMAVALGWTSCSDDDALKLSADQQALLGRAVNFSASIADDFLTRTSYNASGAFNENDLMVIYRQYSTDNGKTFDEDTQGYRIYSYQPQTVGNTGIAINTEWKVKPGKTGYEPSRGTFTQTAADSLTWDNSQTVRFRAWALSNLSGCLDNDNWDRFYPDFTRSDWVTATGPTVNVPLQLKHLGCRIAIIPISGNQISKVEISTDPKDYMYEDNADSEEDDTADKVTEEEAKERAAAVEAAYKRLCTPGGVDFDNGLKALSVAYKNSGIVSEIETEAAQKQMIGFGEKTADELAEEAVHPEFHYNNGNQYFVAIPHDISNDTNTQGERLSLPYYTRFRVYLRDVNNGDKEDATGYEGGYHIFALNDVVEDGTREKMFTEDNGGLQFIAGYSYQFQVGYKYGSLQVKMKNSLSWAQQDIDAANLIDQQKSQPTENSYTWWKEAIDNAILKVTSGESGNYNPEFNISTAEEFVEFIQLVNGTAAQGHTTAGYTLERGESYTDETATGLQKRWKWYKVVGDTKTEITKEEAELDGFVFYHTYSPADGDNVAHYDEAVLDGPYSFYSTLVNRKFRVNITADIDLQDWPLSTIANSADNPFLGILDGGFHTLSNVYMADGYLFDYAGKALDDMGTNGNGAVISNLVIDSEHPICIVKEGTQVKILGIRLLAPSNKSAFAEKLAGLSYLVGCSNEGDATNGLVGEANNLVMYGCMQTAEGITGGALLGNYSTGSQQFFAPQTGTVEWGNFMCNFYDIDHSPNAHAVGSVTDAYQRQQYIRGSKTYMLCAWNDNLVTDRETLANLKNQTAFAGFYGLAPWKAMNYAIYQYNQSDMGKLYPCTAQYVKGGTTGYSHRYPVLTSGTPTVKSDWNVLELLN